MHVPSEGAGCMRINYRHVITNSRWKSPTLVTLVTLVTSYVTPYEKHSLRAPLESHPVLAFYRWCFLFGPWLWV